MEIHAKAVEYTSADEMRSTYAAARKRLHGKLWADEEKPAKPEPIAMPAVMVEAKQPVPSAYLLTMLLLSACRMVDEPGQAVLHTIHKIKLAVSAEFGVSIIDLDSHRKDRKSTTARHAAVALCRKLTNRTLPEIARHFDHRDHTTILHSVQKMRPIIDELSASLPADASLDTWAAALRLAIEVRG